MSKKAINDVITKGKDLTLLEQVMSGEHESTLTFKQYPDPVEIMSYDPVDAMEVESNEVVAI